MLKLSVDIEIQAHKLKSVISNSDYFSYLIHLLYFVVSGMPACVDLTVLHVDFAHCKQGNKRLMVSCITNTEQ